MTSVLKSATPSIDAVLATIDRPLRAWSLIVTVFGDAVAPRGGSIWLGNLLDILGTLNVDAGVVRTALSRLVADGWVDRERLGRNSFYRLTPKAQGLSEAAAARIYQSQAPPSAFTGWTLAVLPDARASGAHNDARTELRTVVAQHGVGMLSASTAIWPQTNEHDALTTEAHQLSALTFSVAPQSLDIDRAILADAWPLDIMRQQFIPLQKTFDAITRAQSTSSNLDALALRVLLIHEWRRIILRTPNLPSDLLPDDWPLIPAQRSVADLYAKLSPAAEIWLDTNGRHSRGSLTPQAHRSVNRFSAI